MWESKPFHQREDDSHRNAMKDKYKEIETTTLREIIDVNGGIENLDSKVILKYLKEKYLNKKIRISFDQQNYTIDVQRIDAVLSVSAVRDTILWLFYFSNSPLKLNDFKVAPGPDDKIIIIEETIKTNPTMDPYGEEDWNDD